MNSVFFKIIVPNYNNMPYIKKCLDSILQQTFQDFFIVIADDLSTDKSDKFCEYYERKFPAKIKFIRLNEKGYAGATRNAALDWNKIESEYIWYLDSDDWLYDNNVLQNMYNAIIQNNYPDILRCSQMFLQNGNLSFHRAETDIKRMAYQGAGPTWNCINSKFKDIRFKEQRAKCNDVIYFLRLLNAVDTTKIAQLNMPCSVYNRDSTTSCQNNIQISKSIDCIYALSQLPDDILQENIDTDAAKILMEKELNFSRIYRYVKRLNVDDVLKNSYVISIDKERQDLLYKNFEKQNLQMPTVIIGNTDQNLSVEQRCATSHVNVIKEAKRKNLPYVFVFEDDAYPCDNCKDLWQKYLNLVPDDANMVLFGWSYVRPNDANKNKIYNIIPTDKKSIIYGAHAYLLFNTAYDRYINFFKYGINNVADGDIFKHIPNSYIIDRPLFIQYCKNTSMNNHYGYIYFGNHDTPPEGFSVIEDEKYEKYRTSCMLHSKK